MNNFFKEENVLFVDKEITDWKEAIKIAVDLLIKNKSATEKLYDAIIESTNKYGAYYILTPKVALAHAEPSDYCLKPDIAIVFLKNEVKFCADDNHNAKLIVALSCPDGVSHINYLKQFAEIFSNETIKSKLLKMNNLQELKTLVEENSNG